jgi:hypothetical protein
VGKSGGNSPEKKSRDSRDITFLMVLSILKKTFLFNYMECMGLIEKVQSVIVIVF